MYDLTKKIVERITEEIVDGKSDAGTGSDISNSREKKLKNDKSDDDIKINAPEFSFIFTVALDGKLNISDKAEKAPHKYGEYRDGKSYRCGVNIKDGVIDRRHIILSEIFAVGDKDNCGNGKNESGIEEQFQLSRLGEFDKPYIKDFVFSSFIKDSLLAYWKYNVFKDDAFDDILSGAMKRYANGGGDLHELPEKTVELARSFTSEIKLFSCGSVSILIKSEQTIINSYDNGIKLSPAEIKGFLSFPDLAADRTRYVVKGNEVKVAGAGERKWEVCGFLNIFAHGLASHVFNKFFRSLSDFQHRKGCGYLSVNKILKNTADGELLVTDGFEMGRYTNKVVKTIVSIPPDLAQLSNRVGFDEDVHGDLYLFYTGDPLKQDERRLYKQYKDNKVDLVSLTKLFALIKSPPEKLDEIEISEELLDIFVRDGASGNFMQKYAIKKEMKEVAGKLWNAPLNTFPYIGIKFNSLSSEYVDADYQKLASLDLLSIVAFRKPDFLNGKSMDDDSLHNNSIIRTEKDTIVAEPGGLAVVEGASTSKMKEVYIGSASESCYGLPYNTIIFCFEAIFAAEEAARLCCNELEDDVSARMNGVHRNGAKGLLMFSGWTKIAALFGSVALFSLFALGMPVVANCGLALVIILHMCSMLRVYRGCSELSELIVRIRSLSFCGDASLRLFSSLRSEIVIKVAKAAYGFGLKAASKRVKEHLKRYEYVLKNSSRAAVASVNLVLLFLITYGVIINLLFSENMIFSWRELVMTFGMYVSDHESLVQFIVRSVAR